MNCSGFYFTEQTGQKETVLRPDRYTFPFTVYIPFNVPSSYESSTGQVRYLFQAEVDRPWAFNMRDKHVITVLDPLDLNTIPNLEVRVPCVGS